MVRLRPQTAREALYAIRYRIRLGGDPGGMIGEVAKLAQRGLEPDYRLEGFELTDALGDRLAEAHSVLRDLLDLAPEGQLERDLHERAAQALALPPDIEAIVDRRIG